MNSATIDSLTVERIKRFASEVCGPDGVRAIFVVGSQATGRTDKHSDIDVQVIHRFDWWLKSNAPLGEIELDIVFAPLEYYREALGRLHEVVAEMLLDAITIEDAEALVPALRESAAIAMRIRASNALRPNPFDHVVRHRPLSMLRDAEDLLDRGDMDGVLFITASAVAYSLQTFVTRKYRSGDAKRLYRDILIRESRLHDLLHVFQAQLDGRLRIAAAYDLVNAFYEDIGGLSPFGNTERMPWQHALAFFGG